MVHRLSRAARGAINPHDVHGHYKSGLHGIWGHVELNPITRVEIRASWDAGVMDKVNGARVVFFDEPPTLPF
jgi:hypothetical protein